MARQLTQKTFRDYLRVVFRRKRIVLGSFFGMLVAVFAGLQLKTPEYESKVTMLILATKHIVSPYYKDVVDYRPTDITLTQSEIVKSNPVIERVVKRMRLSDQPADYEKQFASPLRSLIIDARTRAAEKKNARLSAKELEKARFRSAVESLKKKITVEPVRETDLFTVTVSDYSASRAAQLANAVSRSYCIFDLEQQMAELTQKYGDKHLFVTQLKDNLEKMEANLTGEAVSNIEAIGPASVKIIEQAGPASEPAGKSKKVLLLAGMVLGLCFGVVLAFVAEGFDNTLKTPDELQDILGVPSLGYVPVRKSAVSWSVNSARLAANAGLWAGIVLVALQLAVGCLSADMTNPIVRFLNNATAAFLAPMRLFFPAQQLPGFEIPALLTLIGLLAGRVFVSRMLARLLAVSVKAEAVLKPHQRDGSYSRAYAGVAEQLLLAMKSGNHKSLLVCSALPREGTTTMVANLGVQLAARSHARILLVDAQLRRHALHTALHIENGCGLTDVLMAKSDLGEMSRKAADNLYVLTSGQPVEEPVSLLGSPKMKELINKAKEKYDLVIIDAAPLKSHHDAAALSPYVDSVLLLVSEGTTRKEVLKASVEPLERSKANIIGSVLNRRTFAIPDFIYKRA